MSRFLVATRTGIRIGMLHVPKRPLHSFSESEELLQRALLANRSRWTGHRSEWRSSSAWH